MGSASAVPPTHLLRGVELGYRYHSHIDKLRELPLASRPGRAPVSTEPIHRWAPLPDGEAVQLEVGGFHVELGGRPILRDLNITFLGGEVTALVGRNGVGKTTLLRTLVGLQGYSGRVRVVPAQRGQERLDLGLVFQNADLQLFNATVGEDA